MFYVDQFLKSLLNLLQCCFCFVFWFFGRKACEFLAPWPGIEPVPPAVEGKVLNAWCWWFSCKVMSNSCDPMHCSPPGPSVHGIFSARILEWLPFPFPGDLPDQGIKPRSPALQVDSLLIEPPGKTPPEKPSEECGERTVASLAWWMAVVAEDLGFVESCSPGLCPASPTPPQQVGRNAWRTRQFIFQEFSKAKFCFIILSMYTFVTTYPLEIRVESPNHTEPTDF